MYHKGKKQEEITQAPFDVICTNCGSHNVDVIAFEHWDLEIKCNMCGACLVYGKYNPTTYKEEEQL